MMTWGDKIFQNSISVNCMFKGKSGLIQYSVNNETHLNKCLLKNLLV